MRSIRKDGPFLFVRPTLSKRGNLGKFLKEADTGKYQGWVLVVEELDRLSRMGIHETNELIQRIWNAGLTIELSKSGRVIAKGRDMQTAMMNLFEAWTAEQRRLQMKNYALNGAAKKRDELIAWLALPEEIKEKTPCPILGALLPAWLKKGPHGLPVEVTKVARSGKHIKKIPAIRDGSLSCTTPGSKLPGLRRAQSSRYLHLVRAGQLQTPNAKRQTRSHPS